MLYLYISRTVCYNENEMILAKRRKCMPTSFLNGKRILMICADFFDLRNQLIFALRNAGCIPDPYD